MATKLSEIDALKLIDDSLAHLSSEEKQRVFSFLAAKHSLSANNIQGNKSGGNLSGGGGQTISDIKQFLSSKKPQGFYEQIACLGYYLEKIQGLDSFNTKQITKANTDARVSKIPNPSLYVMHTQSTYGYFSQVGGGKKAITARGEALVEALPDREAVKVALESNPIKKKSSSRKKKSKSKS